MTSLSDFVIGQRAERTFEVTADQVEAFAFVSGDRNPVHLDEAFAAKTRFERRIAHGALLVSHISAVLGMDLPGPGAIYLSQSIRFRKPVFIGDRITAGVEIESLNEQKRIIVFKTSCFNGAGELVAEGESTLMVDGAAKTAGT